MTAPRTFPLLTQDAPPHHSAYAGRSTIPWSLAEKVYEDYALLNGHEQSLDRIRERGGFGWNEIVAIQIEAAEKRDKLANPTSADLTENAREAFNETSGTKVNTSRHRTGGAW